MGERVDEALINDGGPGGYPSQQPPQSNVQMSAEHFEEFKETRDSLWFYNLNEFEHGNRKHVDSLKFKKSDVAISQDKSSNIIKIIIEDLIIDQASNEIISNITYHLTPKNRLDSKRFSDYGIFKEVVK